MATTPGYDPKKAAVFNQLRQDGLSEDAAAAQAGITDAESENYAIGMNGQLGSFVEGFPASGKLVDKGQFTNVDYDVKADAPVSSKTPTTYTTTSTTEVSGGGSTTITAGEETPTAASRALQPAIDAKQAEIEQFNRDNPSNFARRKLGLPPLTPEENQKRNDQALELSKQKVELANQQASAMLPGTPTITTVPNTTTTTTTVTSGTTSVNTAIQSPGGSDPAINQQTETNLGVAVGAANENTTATAVSDTSDPYAASRQAAFLEANEIPVSIVDLASDPNTNAGGEVASQAELIQNQNAQALASDPNTNAGGEAGSQAEIATQIQNRNAQAVASDPNTNIGNETADPNFAFNPDAEDERANLNASIKQGTLDKARAQNTIANQRKTTNNADWRVKLRLAPNSNYLYNAPEPGILGPLKGTGGIIFPYTPKIDSTYKANYASTDLTHSNYKGYFYQGSSVDAVSLSCMFTAQSTTEADYLLAVIQFFKSATKMFYGQDPQRGTPPPLVYLTGLGEFQYNEHPCVIQSFQYDLPSDVDYIRARSPNVNNSNMLNQRQSSNGSSVGTTWGNGILGNFLGGAINRLANANLPKGGMTTQPPPQSFGVATPTYVPTKINIAITLLPMQSRKQQSQQFSLRQYANGDLLKGGFW